MSLLDDVSIVVTPNGYKAGELYAVIPVPTEGAEEITNGDFSSGSTGWTIINGTVTDKYNASMTSYQSGIRVTPFNKTGTFKVTFDLVVTSGSCKFDAGGANNQIFTTSGAKEILVINTSKFEFNAFNLGWVGTLDNVSVKEYTSADMDVTRATAATRVDENGLVNYAEVVSDTELVTNGDFATDSNWTKGTGWTISGGTANANTSGNYINLYQNSVFTVGKAYKYEFTVSNYSQGDVRFTQSGVDISGLKSANGIYTGVFSASQTALYIQGVNSFIGSIDNVSVKEVTRDNVPRIDYTGGGCPHILAEPQRTNLVTYSEDFSQWSTARVTVLGGFTAPDGSNNAYKITNGSPDGILYLSSASDTNYTKTIYARTVSGTGTAQLLSHNANTNNTFNLTEEWQRFEVNTTTDVPTIFYAVDFRGSGTLDELLIWGAQAEDASYATSIIPTSGSTVTRNQDIFTRDGIGSLINSTEGVLFVEMAALSDDGTFRQLTLNDGTTANRILVDFTYASNQIRVFCGSGGVSQVSETFNVTSSLSFNKIAFKYKLNDFALWVNGVEVATDTSGITPIGLNKLSFNNGSGSFDFFGKVKQLQVYNTALTDTQLAALTS